MTNDHKYSFGTRELTKSIIEDILSEKSENFSGEIEDIDGLAEKLLDLITPVLLQEVLKQDESDNPEWMVEIANQAVQQNLNEDGSCKYQTAQGYACALSAVKIMNRYLPNDPAKTSSSENKSFDQEEKTQILSAAKEIYDFYKVRFGEESAVKQVIIFVAEKYGIVDWNDLGLHPEQQQDIKSMISQHFESTPI